MTPFGSWVVCATSIKVDEKMNIERMNERFIFRGAKIQIFLQNATFLLAKMENMAKNS